VGFNLGEDMKQKQGRTGKREQKKPSANTRSPLREGYVSNRTGKKRDQRKTSQRTPKRNEKAQNLKTNQRNEPERCLRGECIGTYKGKVGEIIFQKVNIFEKEEGTEGAGWGKGGFLKGYVVRPNGG